jgi:hypothetical protein
MRNADARGRSHGDSRSAIRGHDLLNALADLDNCARREQLWRPCDAPPRCCAACAQCVVRSNQLSRLGSRNACRPSVGWLVREPDSRIALRLTRVPGNQKNELNWPALAREQLTWRIGSSPSCASTNRGPSPLRPVGLDFDHEPAFAQQPHGVVQVTTITGLDDDFEQRALSWQVREGALVRNFDNVGSCPA